MQCPSCGIDVPEHQKFCDECGAPLAPASTLDADLATQPVQTLSDDDAHVTGDTPDGDDTVQSDGTGKAADTAVTTITGDTVDTGDTETSDDTDVARATAIDADLPTEPIDQLPPPDEGSLVGTAAAPLIVPADELTSTFGPPTDEHATTPMEAIPTGHAQATDEMPAIFDGHDDLVEYPTPREPFKLRLILLFSLFGAGAVLMAIVADVIDIRTTRPTSGIVSGIRTLDDLGSNLGLAGFVGAAVMVIGSLLACFGLRWGAGLAGGAGLAVLGWAGLVIGLAELPIAIAESITRTSSESFTLRVTRDLGWWLVAGVGMIGLLVFLASLRSIGAGGRRALNPLIAAATAVAAVVLSAGPLVPVGSATFENNFRSPDPDRDLPTAFFAGRLGQVALIALAGVVGMLIVRSFGLGLTAGGISVPLWLWISSLLELGDNPVGIADRNPGAASTVPHAVTDVGMVLTVALLLIAAVFATVRLTRTSSVDPDPNHTH